MKKTLLSWVFTLITAWGIAQVQPRTPLFEVFTSSTCGPCYSGNIALNEAFTASDGNYTCVKYQMYFPGDGDPYFTEEGYSRSRFYDLKGVPQLNLEGVNEMHPANLTEEMFQAFQAVPARVNLNATYTRDDRKIDIAVTLDPTENILTPFLKLYVAIIENKTFNNVESNGETEFEYVMKKMVPGSLGEQLAPLKVGSTQTFEFSYEFKGEYRLPINALDPIDNDIEHSVEEFDDLSVVVWVQNRTTKEVLQSTWATMTTGTQEQKTDGTGIIALFPNPTRDKIHLHYLVKSSCACQLSIHDLSGNQVMSKSLGYKNYGNSMETIDVSALPAGNYLLQLEAGGNTFHGRFSKME